MRKKSIKKYIKSDSLKEERKIHEIRLKKKVVNKHKNKVF